MYYHEMYLDPHYSCSWSCSIHFTSFIKTSHPKGRQIKQYIQTKRNQELKTYLLFTKLESKAALETTRWVVTKLKNLILKYQMHNGKCRNSLWSSLLFFQNWMAWKNLVKLCTKHWDGVYRVKAAQKETRDSLWMQLFVSGRNWLSSSSLYK